MKFRKMMGCIALGLTCAMIGAGATMAAQNTSAAAEAVTAANSTTTVVTSPFTAAVQQVRNSVVGVSNYQTVRYGSYGNNFYFGYASAMATAATMISRLRSAKSWRRPAPAWLSVRASC